MKEEQFIDRLQDIFTEQRTLQKRFANLEKDRKWPPEKIDIGEKESQKFLRFLGFRMLEELGEAFAHLKNNPHRQQELNEVNKDELYEELIDTFTFFLNICLYVGMTADDLYREFMKKNRINNQRIDQKY